MADFGNTFAPSFDFDSGTYAEPTEATEEYTPQPASHLSSTPRKPGKQGPGKPPRKLTTEQIIAILLLSLVIVGIVIMVLAFLGLFNTTGPEVNLTPSVTVTGPLPSFIPVISG